MSQVRTPLSLKLAHKRFWLGVSMHVPLYFPLVSDSYREPSWSSSPVPSRLFRLSVPLCPSTIAHAAIPWLWFLASVLQLKTAVPFACTCIVHSLHPTVSISKSLSTAGLGYS